MKHEISCIHGKKRPKRRLCHPAIDMQSTECSFTVLQRASVSLYSLHGAAKNFKWEIPRENALH